jgi:hypothetical protein
MKGRSGGCNRKSLAEHRLAGSFRPARHRGLLAEMPASPRPDVVRKPAHLSAGAGRVWEELAPLASAMGTLTAADVAAFVTLCELQATFEAVIAQKTTPAPLAVCRLERETAAALRPYYALFALTAPDRARLRVTLPSPAEPESRLAKYRRPPSKWAGALS